MATVKFPSEMPAASDVGGNDKLMISKDGSGEAFQVSFNAVKEYLEITDIELSPVQGGATEATATVIPSGPAGQNRKMDASPGWYSVGGVPVEATSGHVWKWFWNGTTWSLVDMGELPQAENKIGQWTAKTYTAGQQVVEGGIWYEAVVNTTAAQRPSTSPITVWKPVIVTVGKQTPIIPLSFVLEKGMIAAGGKYNSLLALRLRDDLYFKYGGTLKIKINPGYKYFIKESATTPALGANSTPITDAEKTITVLPSKPYFNFVIQKEDNYQEISPSDNHGFSLELSYMSPFVTELDLTPEEVEVEIVPDFVQGGVNGSGRYASSVSVRLKEDLVLTDGTLRVSINDGYRYFVKQSSSVPAKGLNDVPLTGEHTFAMSPTLKNINFTIQRLPSTVDGIDADIPITPDDDHGFTIHHIGKSYNVNQAELQKFTGYAKGQQPDTTLRDIYRKVEAIEGNGTGSYQTYNNKRFPTRFTQGVISFSDDDGREGVHSQLLPYIVANELPYGIAVITDRFGKTITSPHLGTYTYLSDDQVRDLVSNEFIEIMSHTHTHISLGAASTTSKMIHQELSTCKSILWNKFGVNANALVLPYGSHNDNVLRIASQYHDSVYLFDVSNTDNFNTINNYKIKRLNFGDRYRTFEEIKPFIDSAIANNSWLNICTHVTLSGYWFEDSFSVLSQIIGYARTNGVEILKPTEAFQIYGNMLESSNGFKINAKGVITNGAL